MASCRFRNYHLYCLAGACFLIVAFNRKLLPDTADGARTRETLKERFEERSRETISTMKQLQTAVSLNSSSISASRKDVLGARLIHLNETCKRIGKTTGRSMELTGNKDLHFAYCVVPKAGCTMWLRVLQYIAGQGSRPGGPMALSKYDVHYRGAQFYKKNKLGPISSIKTYLRSMTVRDPYTRLWSAYIDKLLLPDFWVTKGKMIIKMTRTNPSVNSTRCGHDVTFGEFIAYVIKIGHAVTYVNQDKHWLPASDMCDPCTFHPDLITKQETLMDDFNYTATRLGITDVFKSVIVKDPVDFEIEDEVDYIFNIYNLHSKCAGIKELCRRLWQAFQYNGYIPPSETFDSYLTSDNITKSQFLTVIRDIRLKFNVSKSDKKKWRNDAIKNAYAAISDAQKEALVNLYKMDFELFQYDSRPDYF